MQIDGVTYGHLDAGYRARRAARFPELDDAAGGTAGPESAAAHAGLAEIRIGVGSCCVAGGSEEVREALEHGHARVGRRVGGEAGRLCRHVPPDAAGGDRRCRRKSAGAYAKVTPARGGATSSGATSAAQRCAAGSNGRSPLARSPAHRRSLGAGHPLCAGRARRPRCAPSSDQQRISPPSTAANSTRSIWTNIWRMTASARCDAACANVPPERDHRRRHTPPACAGAAARASPPAKMGAGARTRRAGEIHHLQRRRGRSRRVHGPHAARIVSRTASSKGWPSPRTRSARTRACLYIRAEYPLAVQRVREAIARCEAARLARRAACGQRTIRSASAHHGRRGRLRLRRRDRAASPPSKAGAACRACARPIPPKAVCGASRPASTTWRPTRSSRGSSATARRRSPRSGTETSKGTKVFALAGKVARGGLIEVPMGITIREIVEEIGGGVADGRRFKAVQIGGPSGGCMPARTGRHAVDYEALRRRRRDHGLRRPGGDRRHRLHGGHRALLPEFTQSESCGKCTFCRVGTRRMLDILDRLCTGKGKPGDLEKLEELAHQVRSGSLCGLGQDRPQPGPDHPALFPRRIRGPPGRPLPGRQMQAPHPLQRRATTAWAAPICAQPARSTPSRSPLSKDAINEEKCIRCDTCRGSAQEAR